MIKPTDKSDQRFHLPGETESASRKRVDSRELFGVAREVVIHHVGEEYRLRITSQGKLILTK